MGKGRWGATQGKDVHGRRIASERKRKNENTIEELLPQGCTKDGKRYRDSVALSQSFHGNIETRFSLSME